MKLEGRYAVITGANQGFGVHIARHFVGEGAGVMICARDGARLESARAELAGLCAAGNRACARVADVVKEADVQALAAAAFAEFPRVDILVNCAGVAGPRGAVDEMDWEEWRQAIDINLNGTVLVTRAFLPHMKKNRYGKIINISGGGATKPLPHLSAYAASKAAVVRLTETLAMEVRKDHIDVNAIAPGVLATRMVDHFMEVEDDWQVKGYSEEVRKQKSDGQGSFDRAASLCVYLGSKESDGITGKLISAVWDPWDDLRVHRDELAATDIYTLRRIVPGDRGKSWG